MDDIQLNRYSQILLGAYNEKRKPFTESPSGVNPLVSELATWYEKFRNSIEYRDEEVILRASIERNLKRRLALGGNGHAVAGPLLKELVWARYFPESIQSEENLKRVEEIVDFYLESKKEIVAQFKIKESELHRLFFQLMSSEIEETLSPNKIEEIMNNYIYYVLKKNIRAEETEEEMRDAQTFIAIRRAYSKDDDAFLKYKLYKQYYGELSTLPRSLFVHKFPDAHKSIESQLTHPMRHKVNAYVKQQIPPFLIFEELFDKNSDIVELIKDEENFSKTILETCQRKYNTISQKVRRAIIRSVIFIALSKVLIAFGVEGTYERVFLGEVKWFTLSINVIAPILLMIGVGLIIRAPGKKNSEIILNRIKVLLFEPEPKIGKEINFPRKQKQPLTILETIFTILWLAAFILSFGLVTVGLSFLGFNIVSQMVFIFFLAIVSFLAYRISLTAKEYSVEGRQGILTPIIDFFFMPIARVGRYLTEGISQINIFLFILDFLIEAPFKAIVSFFDQWFFFLHSKREELG